MNTYTDFNNTIFYCLDPINPDYTYYHGSGWGFLSCINDQSINLLHREDGAAIEFNGDEEWYYNGKRHRSGGPAIIFLNGTIEWYIDGELHREGGPAEECNDGRKYWWYHGEQINCNSQKEFLKILSMKAFI